MPRGKVDNTRKVVKRPRKDMPRQLPNGNNSDSAATDESFEIPNSPAPSDSIKNGTELGSEEAYSQDFSGEMSKLLERFNSDMNKTMQAKRKKLEQFTQESTRTTTKKVLETNKNQSIERRKLIDHFQSQFLSMIQQGESELEKIKDAEEKMQTHFFNSNADIQRGCGWKLSTEQKKKLLVQQQKHQQQVRIAHSQRLKVLKNLSEEFCKGMNELEESHVEQYSAVHNDLRKEMALLQKKILMETQQQEMMNVRKQLKQFFG